MTVLPHLSQCDVPQDPILVIKAPVLLGLKVQRSIVKGWGPGENR